MIFEDVSNEKDFENKMIKRLRKYGMAFHIECTIPGFPDILFVKGTQVVFIEMKKKRYNSDTPDKLLRPKQIAFHNELKNNRSKVYTVLANNTIYELYDADRFLVHKGTVEEVISIILRNLYEDSV